jgi:hypothetical protein
MKIYNRVIVTSFSLFMLLSLLLWIPGKAVADAPCIINLGFQNPPPKINLSTGNSSIIEINGEINCTLYGTSPKKVYLFAQSTIGSASITPSFFLFTGSNGTVKSDTFIVNLRLSRSYSTIDSQKITVSGYFIQDGIHYELRSISQNVEMAPYYKIEVNTPPPQEIGAGESVSFPLRVTNSGNSEDSFRFELLNMEELCNDQWILPSITDQTFSAKETRTVTISAQAPQTWTLYRNKITTFRLRLTSTQSEETYFLVRKDVSLFVRQEGMYIQGFSPMFALIGLGLVSMILGKKRLSHKKAFKIRLGQSKDLYGKFLMSKR